jgi:hypothetical protein
LRLASVISAYEARAVATERVVRALLLDAPHSAGPDLDLRWVRLSTGSPRCDPRCAPTRPAGGSDSAARRSDRGSTSGSPTSRR